MPDPASLRETYGRDRLDESELAPTWHAQLELWLAEAVEAGLPDPNAMVLATAAPAGAPSARTVLLKGLGGRGLAFYTNLDSRKARELEQCGHAAAVFPWLALERQVVLEGAVEPLDPTESDAYFASRPRASRIAALASPQSRPIASREELERRFAEVAERHPEGTEIARPERWGGLRIVPSAVEFWQGRPGRLHDRLRYRRDDTGVWTIERLAP